MKLVPFIVVLAMTIPAFADWSPPENPDPQAILKEAQADAAAERYEDALAKHVWFYRNALKHRSSLVGVRLSFALMYWQKLGEMYPPAIAKLKEVRDDARKEVNDAKSKDVRAAFVDFEAINRILGDDSETTKLFRELDNQESPVAKEVFELALRPLINSKDYRLCGKYLEPKKSFANSVKIFQRIQQLAKDSKFGAQQLDFAEKKFTNDIAILVALLVVNDRKAEASEVAAAAKKEWKNEAFHSTLDKSLDGVVPKPWP